MNAVSNAVKPAPYQPKHKVRFVTATALFDGHDASVNIMRRILQGSGAEVIHLGHNRSVQEIVSAALQEDAQGIAVTSYQGGHIEFFKYMIDLLREHGGENIKVFGGGGGVIVPAEIEELIAYGVTRIYSPQDGATLGASSPASSPRSRTARIPPAAGRRFCRPRPRSGFPSSASPAPAAPASPH
jgi:methylmalonyl-CoA mutase